MTDATNHGDDTAKALIGIGVALGAYVVALVLGVPQSLTAMISAGHHDGHAHAESTHGHDHPPGTADAVDAEADDVGDGDSERKHDDEHADGHADGHDRPEHSDGHHDGDHGQDDHKHGGDHSEAEAPPVWTVIPFVLLLGSIAVLPLIPATEHWWESNTNRFKVAAGLATVTLCYYALLHDKPFAGHFPTHYEAEAISGPVQWGFVKAILGNAILNEFVPFIVLLFSLYTISGGIRIEGDLEATPMTNATFMAVGGLLASFIGTTGAAMLLIRPLLETNVERKRVVHTVVFFIFVVCNCGGCLLPIGDPPLFLGYLKGVDFFWTLELWAPWLLCNGLLLGLYLLVDHFYHFPKEDISDRQRDLSQVTALRFSGMGLNVPLLLAVVAAVAFLDPTKTVPGTEWLLGEAWHPWMYFREVMQLTLVGLSLALGSREVRQKNSFNFHAIIEVAALFVGIFICMQPALQILGVYGGQLRVDTPTEFFWVTGGLSSVLDNAPTYLVFFETAKSISGPGDATLVAGVPEPILIAISLGAVFMGAMTYIGNGPNFMVKAIAEQSGVRMPSFFGYMGYSCVILLPVLLVVAWQYVA